MLHLHCHLVVIHQLQLLSSHLMRGGGSNINHPLLTNLLLTYLLNIKPPLHYLFQGENALFFNLMFSMKGTTIEWGGTIVPPLSWQQRQQQSWIKVAGQDTKCCVTRKGQFMVFIIFLPYSQKYLLCPELEYKCVCRVGTGYTKQPAWSVCVQLGLSDGPLWEMFLVKRFIACLFNN